MIKTQSNLASHNMYFNRSGTNQNSPQIPIKIYILLMVGTSMTLEAWNFNFLGSETFIQKLLSLPPPPKPPNLNLHLHAVASGFPPYDRTV